MKSRRLNNQKHIRKSRRFLYSEHLSARDPYVAVRRKYGPPLSTRRALLYRESMMDRGGGGL